MDIKDFRLKQLQPAILRLEGAAYFTVWVNEFNIERKYASGAYEFSKEGTSTYSYTSISGSFYIREEDIQTVGLESTFDLTIKLPGPYTVTAQHCHIGSTNYVAWSETNTTVVSFIATSAKVIRDEDSLLLDPKLSEDIQFLDRPKPLLKKSKPQKIKGRVAKVLAVAKRKR